MTFGEAVTAKPLDLVEAALGEFRIIAPRDHALHHEMFERSDRADIAEGCHGASQAIGLFGRKLGRDHGKLHRLFLEQRHAKRLDQHIA